MKFIAYFSILFALFAHQAFGQEAADSDELLSKRGQPILPETGDWSLGFNAVPLVDFALNAVNIMNNTGQTAQNPGYMDGFEQVITGKYFVSEQTAYRVKLGIDLQADNTSTFFSDPLDTSEDPGELEDVFKERSTGIFASAGIELRRGNGRVQGFYGVEGVLSLSSGKEAYDYGLEWNTEAEDAGLVVDGQTRLLEDREGTGFGLGGRGFVGVEYFFAPKMAISVEYGLGMLFSTQGRGSNVFEVYEDGSTSEEEVSGASSGRAFSTEVDNAGASLNLYIYF